MAVSLLAYPVRADSQVWSAYSTTYSEGPGLRLGGAPLVLHAGLATDVGYDSNVFYLPSNPVGAGLLRLRAHLDLATLPPQVLAGDTHTADQTINFRFSTQAEYREYLTSNEVIRAQRSVNVFANGRLNVLPQGPFTLSVGDVFVRTVDPSNQELAGNFASDNNQAEVAARFRPGLGALELGLEDQFRLTFWETSGLQYANQYGDTGRAYVRWHLLPQTALSLEARGAFNHYANTPALNSTPLRVLLGASTLLADWIGLALNAGYGNSFNSTGPSYSMAIGSAQILFYLPIGMRLSADYAHDFSGYSVFGNYYVEDHPSVSFEMPLFHRIDAQVGGGVRFRRYSGLIDPTLVGAVGYSSPNRSDIIYEGRAELNFKPTDWLAVGANYAFVEDQTDFSFIGPQGALAAHYVKHSVFGRIDVAY